MSNAKPVNGRRAWRQWGKRREYKRRRQVRKHQVEYSPLMGWNEQRKANDERIRPPEKLGKALTASDLVGMSMGARKRKRWDMVQSAGQYDAPGAARHIGAPYRIGERLRPCLGCSWCGTPPAENATRHTQCDGSGVLPARKAKR